MGELAFHLPVAGNVVCQDFHLWNGCLFEVDPINQSNFSQLVALQKEKKKKKEEKPAVRAHIGFIFL